MIRNDLQNGGGGGEFSLLSPDQPVTIDTRLGECRDVMASLNPDSVDAVVTDPPYALTGVSRAGSPRQNDPETPHGRTKLGGGFMGKTWDAKLPTVEDWSAALRVAKPGAHLVAFGGTRTFHRLTSAIEDAGWEIRDCLSWLYGQGFPKSHNLDGEHEGWGTALKPAWEPIVLARKPLIGTVEKNMRAHGVGAINIDASRIQVSDADYERNHSGDRGHAGTRQEDRATNLHPGGGSASDLGRWPANVVLDEEAAGQLDAEVGELTSGANPTKRGSPKTRNTYGEFEGQTECEPARGVDVGGASRFFYCAKASRSERNAGLGDRPKQQLLWSNGDQNPGSFQDPGTERAAENNHPTVKPVALMRWLIKLVTPRGGLVLDPFMGSGTTGIAAVLERMRFIGVEREAEYLAIAQARIDYAKAGWI